MNNDEIIRAINSFPGWIYEFDLRGNLTPVADKNTRIGTLQRKNYFFDPLVNLFGGSLEGKRVLDIGCNAGFWSLQAIESGCEFILGIDGRQIHIDQANLVFNVNEIEENRYKFAVGNVFDLDFQEFGSFDIVMCLGFFHHVSKQMQLLEKIAQVNSDIFLLETRVSRLPGAYMAIYHESTDIRVNALDHSLAMVPTKRAVFGMAHQFGYDVVMLRPGRQHSAVKDYTFGRRRAFLCSKKTDLSNLAEESESITSFSELTDIFALGTHWLMRQIPKPRFR